MTDLDRQRLAAEQNRHDDELRELREELARERALANEWLTQRHEAIKECQRLSIENRALREAAQTVEFDGMSSDPRILRQVLLDIHDSLGIRWGDDPYSAIGRLKKENAQRARIAELEAELTQERARSKALEMSLEAMSSDMTRRRYNPKEVWLVTAWHDRYDLKCKACAYQMSVPTPELPVACPACAGEVPKPVMPVAQHWRHPDTKG